MSIDLVELLRLVGSLDDSEGADTPRERFRAYLRESVREVGVLRDYVETCARNSGPQFARALQDLVNRLGEELGFRVSFGRYGGRSGGIGYDGHWVSPLNAHVVVEVKTTDTYAIQTAVLLDYINRLLSAGDIPHDARRLGLYVVARPDCALEQLENAIVAEKRDRELRIASVDSLLSLAELLSQYDVDHESVVGVIYPSGPSMDAMVDLMASLVAQEAGGGTARLAAREADSTVASEETTSSEGPSSPAYYLTPVRWKGRSSPLEEVGKLLEARKYAFGERTPGRRYLKSGDWICFYASGFGVFAHAWVASAARKHPLPQLTHDPESYPWTFDLGDVSVYADRPIELAREVRCALDAFAGADVDRPWGWFVTSTRTVTHHDFLVLTGRLGDTDG